MSDTVPASSLTGVSVPVGWTPTSEIVLAYLKKNWCLASSAFSRRVFVAMLTQRVTALLCFIMSEFKTDSLYS